MRKYVDSIKVFRKDDVKCWRPCCTSKITIVYFWSLLLNVSSIKMAT